MSNLMRTIHDPKTYISNSSEGRQFKINNLTVEHRSNNAKRDFLFVNKTQCKHIPCSPIKMIKACEILAQEINSFFSINTRYANKVLVIAFAETATAIGNIVANYVRDCTYIMTTTREDIPNSKELITFEEEHSHSTTQKLLTYDDGSFDIYNYDFILFIDDEITTGNTILNFIKAFEKRFPTKRFSYGVASICNWMNIENRRVFKDKSIETFYLIEGILIDASLKLINNINSNIEFESRIDNLNKNSKDSGLLIHYSAYDNKSKNTSEDNIFRQERLGKTPGNLTDMTIREFTRKDHILNDLIVKIKGLIERLNEQGNNITSIRVIGTEEFMYIPIMVAAYLEEARYEVICHSTTRSPIDKIQYRKGMTQVSGIQDNIVSKYSVLSPYDKNRETFIYNINEWTDLTIIITDVDMDYDTKMDYYDLLKPYCENIALYNV